MHSQTQQIGTEIERSAEALLVSRGLRLVTRNYLCRAGEIDLVMLDGEHLVFVEVRLRSNNHYVNALESVDRRKQQKLIRAAQTFLQQHSEFSQHFCRFDVVASPHGEAQTLQLTWIKDAFQC